MDKNERLIEDNQRLIDDNQRLDTSLDISITENNDLRLE